MSIRHLLTLVVEMVFWSIYSVMKVTKVLGLMSGRGRSGISIRPVPNYRHVFYNFI